jgi:hypothetical protein
MALLQKAYLGSTPLFRNEDWFENESNTFVSQGYVSNVTASASIHTKGAWSQIIASTASNADTLLISVDGLSVNNANAPALLDIGFGASGSEVVKIADVAVGNARSNGNLPNFGCIQFIVPFQVPSGTRIAARIQGLIASDVAGVLVQAFSLGDYSTAPTSVDTIGSDTSTSTGASMSGSSGSWVQLTSSTSRAYRGVVLVPSLNATSTISTISVTYDIGTGASGSEAVFGTMPRVQYTSAEDVSCLMMPTAVFGKAIPSGTRLAVRHNIASSPSLYQVTLIGIP